ncbi:hypothetical protein JZ751_026793 [Albula glossodonta]|uniref:Uncharacterized protein n=1 Tax=Albula glossodonta TaxID=121402 RepID=A0A8T2PGZ1_9TELE|nr:hypothetical protein JZ751_026793 [Albula glossodonta]
MKYGEAGAERPPLSPPPMTLNQPALQTQGNGIGTECGARSTALPDRPYTCPATAEEVCTVGLCRCFACVPSSFPSLKKEHSHEEECFTWTLRALVLDGRLFKVLPMQLHWEELGWKWGLERERERRERWEGGEAEQNEFKGI